MVQSYRVAGGGGGGSRRKGRERRRYEWKGVSLGLEEGAGPERPDKH